MVSSFVDKMYISYICIQYSCQSDNCTGANCGIEHKKPSNYLLAHLLHERPCLHPHLLGRWRNRHDSSSRFDPLISSAQFINKIFSVYRKRWLTAKLNEIFFFTFDNHREKKIEMWVSVDVSVYMFSSSLSAKDLKSLVQLGEYSQSNLKLIYFTCIHDYKNDNLFGKTIIKL